MVAADVPQVGELLRRYLGRFDVEQEFGSDREVEHWFLSGAGGGGGEVRFDEDGAPVGRVVWAYVVEVSGREMLGIGIGIGRCDKVEDAAGLARGGHRRCSSGLRILASQTACTRIQIRL
jgi:hypothetical protein